ncbi:hypothetical protein Tco_0032890 [Tanacetum coccineum]
MRSLKHSRSFKNEVKINSRRNQALIDQIEDYALESATRILNMVPTKKVDKTPYELRYGKVPNLSYLKKIVGRAIDLEEIQDEDTSPSKITSKIPMEVEGFKPPQEEEILIRRSERSRRVPNRLCLNVEAEEHSLGDLNEPTSYKAAMLDLESNKWINAMNAEIQSMIDNMTDRVDTKSQTRICFILNGRRGLEEPSKFALHFANEPGVQRGAKHYHRRYHYVRESIALGEIRFLKVHTDDSLADLFTKALSKGQLTQHARNMGLRLASSFM